jgi:hypothetical protein
MNNKYKSENDLSKRIENFNRLKSKFPDKIPIIIQSLNNTITFHKNKFLIDDNLNLSALMYNIRKQIILNNTEAFYLFTSSSNLLNHQSSIIEVYENYKDKEDGFLYLFLEKENTFGKIKNN